jgi:cytochrome c-type biogenesis protein CcmH/NrfG
MANTRNTSAANQWTSPQAYTLAVACLVVGIAGGWFIRGSQAPQQLSEAASAPAASSTSQPKAEQLKRMADKQAEHLLAQLKADPNNPELLANLGNVYFDAQQFPTSIEFYQQSLQRRPTNASVRTDMATAYWYIGNADTAIAEFTHALADEPNKPNALFNLGAVQWQGKMEVEAALATWQKLLDTHPDYEGKAKLVELMAQVKKHSGIKPGTQAKALPE